MTTYDSNNKNKLIRFKRGNLADLTTLQTGEPGFAIDTNQVFIGDEEGNLEIATVPYVNSKTSDPYFADIQNKPTTLAGYGILDAYTKSYIDTALSNKASVADLNGKAPSVHFHNATDIIEDDDHLFITATERVNWNNKAESIHTHEIADVNGLSVALSNKAESSHIHSPSQIITNASNRFVSDSDISYWNMKANSVDVYNKVESDGRYVLRGADGEGIVYWTDIADKPATFPPDAHTHAYSTLTGIPSTFTPSAHVHAQSDITGLTTALSGKEPTITGGTTAQYWRGDKTWQALNSTSVGLGNVTNESKATMFTNPTFTGTVSGVTKAHVGLGNVDNTSDANKPVSSATATALAGKSDTTHTHAVFSTTANGFVPLTTTSNTTDFLRRDGTWATPPGGGGGSVAWGSITGTLSAQTDLQNALNAKANNSTLTSYMQNNDPSYTGVMQVINYPFSNGFWEQLNFSGMKNWAWFHNDTNDFLHFVPSATADAYDWEWGKGLLITPYELQVDGNMVYHTGNLSASVIGAVPDTGGTVTGTLSATTLQESGVNLSAKYVPISGNMTITGVKTFSGGVGAITVQSGSTIDTFGTSMLRTKLSGFKQWRINRFNNTISFVPSTLADGTTDDFANDIIFTDSGEVQANTFNEGGTALSTKYSLSSHTHGVFNTTTNGFVPMTTTSNTTDFLRRDGTWATPAGGGGGVTSVNTRTGAVVLTKADVGLTNVDNESKATMFTNPTFTGINSKFSFLTNNVAMNITGSGSGAMLQFGDADLITPTSAFITGSNGDNLPNLNLYADSTNLQGSLTLLNTKDLALGSNTLRTSGTTMTVSTGTSGTLQLRPNGVSSTTGQVVITTSGVTINSTMTKTAGVVETGFFGTGGYTASTSTSSCSGQGVNFRFRRSAIPSSITTSPTSSTAAINILDITQNGFWGHINGAGTSGVFLYWRGTYTTVS